MVRLETELARAFLRTSTQQHLARIARWALQARIVLSAARLARTEGSATKDDSATGSANANPPIIPYTTEFFARILAQASSTASLAAATDDVSVTDRASVNSDITGQPAQSHAFPLLKMRATPGGYVMMESSATVDVSAMMVGETRNATRAFPSLPALAIFIRWNSISQLHRRFLLLSFTRPLVRPFSCLCPLSIILAVEVCRFPCLQAHHRVDITSLPIKLICDSPR